MKKNIKGKRALEGVLQRLKNQPNNNFSFKECQKFIMKKNYNTWIGWSNETISWPPDY